MQCIICMMFWILSGLCLGLRWTDIHDRLVDGPQCFHTWVTVSLAPGAATIQWTWNHFVARWTQRLSPRSAPTVFGICCAQTICIIYTFNTFNVQNVTLLNSPCDQESDPILYLMVVWVLLIVGAVLCFQCPDERVGERGRPISNNRQTSAPPVPTLRRSVQSWWWGQIEGASQCFNQVVWEMNRNSHRKRASRMRTVLIKIDTNKNAMKVLCLKLQCVLWMMKKFLLWIDEKILGTSEKPLRYISKEPQSKVNVLSRALRHKNKSMRAHVTHFCTKIVHFVQGCQPACTVCGPPPLFCVSSAPVPI